MKFLRSLVNIIAAILTIGGTIVLALTYFTNKPFISYISSILTNAQFGSVMKRSLYGILAIIVGLILFALSLKLSGAIRRREKEKRALEKERMEEQKLRNRQLEEEAKAARSEAEAMRKEAEEAKTRFDLRFGKEQEDEAEPEGTVGE